MSFYAQTQLSALMPADGTSVTVSTPIRPRRRTLADVGSVSPIASGVDSGRGVLHGAFAILEELSHTDDGIGLTELSARTGLAKSTAYRLAEQLVTVGAAQRVDHRYFIGSVIARLGSHWQPDPLLRRVSDDPVRTLSRLARATAAVYVLHLDHARLVCAVAPAGQSWIPVGEFDADNTPHTAVGRVLLAAQPCADRPASIPEPQWQLWRARLHDRRFAVTDSDRAPEGCCVAAAPVWGPGGYCAGAAAVLVHALALPQGVVDLLVHTARHIGHALRCGAAPVHSPNPAVMYGHDGGA